MFLIVRRLQIVVLIPNRSEILAQHPGTTGNPSRILALILSEDWPRRHRSHVTGFCIILQENMSNKDVPTARYKLKHRENNEAPIHACVHFITYGLHYGKTRVEGVPVLFDLDLSQHQPPPGDLCEQYTGQDKQLAKSFFAEKANEAEYHRTLGKVGKRLHQVSKHEPPGSCVACMIHCHIGRHRSVAMAERLAKAVARWDGYKVGILHLDLEKGEKTQAENGGCKRREMSDGEPARGRTRSRHRTQATSKRRVSGSRSRRSAATTDAVIPPREAPLREKQISWEAAKIFWGTLLWTR